MFQIFIFMVFNSNSLRLQQLINPTFQPKASQNQNRPDRVGMKLTKLTSALSVSLTKNIKSYWVVLFGFTV